MKASNPSILAPMTTYFSTRGAQTGLSFTDVLLGGLATDGGLYLPESWPTLSPEELKSLSGRSYSDIAYAVMKPFVGDDIPDEDFKRIIAEVYAEHFSHAAVAPLVQIGPSSWIMELFHGPTIAFKDYALQLLGRLFDYVLEQKGERVTIVGATSGDTGSAAIEACKACKNIDIFILHPHGRTSDVQRRQMTSVIAPNVHNIALEGTFDDCQDHVKSMFNDETFRGDMRLSAVNSINWARIMAQIVYYVTSALSLGAPYRKVAFAVPTGNFGNVFAAYGARQMGLPIDKLVIGSNRNDILTRFFNSGEMKKTQVEPSLSPSMDIQISSNFERYLCDLMGRDTQALVKTMTAFKETGHFELGDNLMKQAREDFAAYACDDETTLAMMRECFGATGYAIDPHTAVGLYAGWKAMENGDLSSPSVPLIALACAHPAKFPDAVEKAIGTRPPLPPHLADLFDREEKYDVLQNDLETLKTYIKERVKA